MTATFRRHRWRIIWQKPKRAHGNCEGPHVRGRAIRINPAVHQRSLLYLAIHEALHACHWDLDEEAVTETAEDITRFLWRIGFRLQQEELKIERGV